MKDHLIAIKSLCEAPHWEASRKQKIIAHVSEVLRKLENSGFAEFQLSIETKHNTGSTIINGHLVIDTAMRSNHGTSTNLTPHELAAYMFAIEFAANQQTNQPMRLHIHEL